MPKIFFNNKKLYIDDRETPLLSGEMHYWRINPLYWERCLLRTRELGIHIIASYICWDFHEYESDKLDFHGKTNPNRNLKAFLELVEEKDFWIIIRPGPYIYSEWAQAGIPERFSRLHRMHPDFLKAAKHYMANVVEILKPHLITNGGRIILLQADNEIDPFWQSYGEQLGLYGGNSLFQQFLLEKYSSLDGINEVWNCQFQNISEAKATMFPLLTHSNHRRRYLDFREFCHWFVNLKARWMIQTYRELGVDIPIYLNTYPSCAVQNWRQLNEIADFVGIDQYPTNEFSHLPDEHFTLYKDVSYAASVLHTPYIAEFECGIWHGWHYETKVLTANHYQMACLTALAGGIVGWNWYMLVDRDNWYMSPINPKGNIRPELYVTFKQIVKIFNKINPSHCQKLTDIAVTYNENHLTAEALGHSNNVMKALYEADLDFVCCDLLKNNMPKKLLFYNGPEWLSNKEIQHLVGFVENGGNIVCFQTFPSLDENFKSCNLLHVQFPQGTTLKKKVQLQFNNNFIELLSPLFLYPSTIQNPIIAQQIMAKTSFQEESELYEDIEVGTSYIIGYEQNIGKGKIVVIGCKPTPELLTAIIKSFNCKIYSHSATPKIHTALLKGDESYFLIIINDGNEDKAAKIWLDNSIFANHTWRYTDLFTKNEEIVSFGDQPNLTADLSRKSGTVMQIQLIKGD